MHCVVETLQYPIRGNIFRMLSMPPVSNRGIVRIKVDFRVVETAQTQKGDERAFYDSPMTDQNNRFTCILMDNMVKSRRASQKELAPCLGTWHRLEKRFLIK